MVDVREWVEVVTSSKTGGREFVSTCVKRGGRLRYLRQVVLAVLCLLPCVPALAWWDDAWTLRKQIVVDTSGTGGNVAEATDNSVVLVRLHAGNFTHFADLKPDGSDLRFIAGDDKTPLQFHIERLDIQQEIGLVWVQVPKLAGNSDQNAFFMYFGNPKGANAANSGSTYVERDALVWHFSDAKGAVADATTHANNASAGGVRPFAAGLIGFAGGFDGTVHVSAAASPSLTIAPERGATLSMWVNLEAPQQDAVLLDLRDAGGAAITVALAGQTPYVTYLATAAGVPVQARNDTTTIVPKAWTHIAVVLGEGKLTLLVNGGESASVPLQMGAPLTPTISLGALADGTRALNAVQVDEFRFSQAVPAPGAIATAIASEGVGGALLTYGVDGGQDEQAGEPSYLLITMQSVTIDGWVVIAILVVMFMASLVVMLTKGLVIRAIRKANATFLAAFREIGDSGLDRLDHAETDAEKALAAHPMRQALSSDAGSYQASSLYHLYHLGMEETRKRTKATNGRTVLSGQTMDAIRAALHAANIRETQKLNSGMVLLTLSISGGPFLGLLGTVLGVMITFAAIAHTGEVDVAAIAPGTAAALAATVAGLAVAIPALFAYNYLTIRIREITADNEVFLDEFVTRVAEQYS